jgi:hypothetical protein
VSYLRKVGHYNILILFFSKWQFLKDKIGIIKKSSQKHLFFLYIVIGSLNLSIIFLVFKNKQITFEKPKQNIIL